MNKKTLSAALIKYLVPCFAVCFIGNIIIGVTFSYLFNWYMDYKYYQYEGIIEINNIEHLFAYRLLRYGNLVIIPMWSVLCLWVTVKVYCRREITSPLKTLMKASDKILNDDLDFKVECDTDNELGSLCGSFENMRQNLYNSNYSLWKALEERKRLNSAFSHDLRTPITVLSGYMELLEKCGEKLSADKQAEIRSKMAGQIDRLKNYTEKMSGIHKLEDIIPDIRNVTFSEICEHIEESGTLLCGGEMFEFTAVGDREQAINTDPELLMEIFLNLASNAKHYTQSYVRCKAKINENRLYIEVSDNGKGFSEEAMRKAWKPFYRDENEDDKNHFGLGLYICWLLSRKLGGGITIENNADGGGKVTAEIISADVGEKC